MKTNEWVGPHNGYAVGDFLYLSHYQDGVKIFDISVPDDPVEVAFYDTFPDLPVDLFEGCWGVHPFQGPDRVFLSDRTYGYFHVSFNEARRTEVFGCVRDANTMLPIQGAIFESVTAARTTATDANGDYSFKTGSGIHQIAVRATGYIPHATALELLDNGSLEHDVLLTPTVVDVPDASPGAGLRVRVSPNPTRGVVTMYFETPTDLAGAEVRVDIYDVGGRLVRALTREAVASASFEITWDGRSEAGFQVAGGVYLAQARIGDVTRSERVVVKH